MKVWLNGSSRGRRIDRTRLRRIAATTCVALGFPDAELGLTLARDAEIAELAGHYGRPARPTDVLAFALADGGRAELCGDLLGDVIVSLDTAERQARRRRVSLERELGELVIHGVLHLLGMDHLRSDDAHNMRTLERHLRWLVEEQGA